VRVGGLSGVKDVAGGLGGASEGYHNLALSSAIPPPTITNPQGNTYDSDGFFSVSGSAQAGSTVELFEGTTSEGSTQADFSSGAWSIDLSEVSEGAHTYSAKAKDAEGNTSSASSSVTVTVEKTPLSGTVSINDEASRTRTRLVTLTLSATDPSPGSGVTDMRISTPRVGYPRRLGRPTASPGRIGP
jgi:large repetitive protein